MHLAVLSRSEWLGSEDVSMTVGIASSKQLCARHTRFMLLLRLLVCYLR